MKKRIMAVVVTAAMVMGALAGCGSSSAKETQAPASGDSETAAESTAAASTGETAEKVGEGVDVKDLKVGFIFIGDENEGYTTAHYAGAKGMQEALGLSDDQIIIKWNIPEDETCYDAAVDLADQGCNIVFAKSFGHESYILQAAAEFPDVQFVVFVRPTPMTAVLIFFQLLQPHTPSTRRLVRRWKPFSASSVRAPKMPSMRFPVW